MRPPTGLLWNSEFMMSEVGDITLSSYAGSLPDEARSRYLNKIGKIGGIDPFVPVL